MNSQNRTWESLKTEYLHQVEKALSLVNHPRSKGVLDDVSSHLDRRFAELPADQHTWEDFQAIITDMGPPCEYAELLDTRQTLKKQRPSLKFVVLLAVVLGIGVVAILILPKLYQPDHDSPTIPPKRPPKIQQPEQDTFKIQRREDTLPHPFVNDARILGNWQSVDFVKFVGDFEPEIKTWQGELFLKKIRFMEHGRMSHPNTWSKGWIWHGNGKIKAQYEIKVIGGEHYLFFPWLSGDVTIRGQRPSYYVLKKVPAAEKTSSDTQSEAEKKTIEGAISAPLDINAKVAQSETNIIVPGVGVGDYKFGMSKDEVLERIGELKGDSPKGQGRSVFKVDGLHLGIVGDSLKGITVLSPRYKFANGLGVGDSEQKVKEHFGNDFDLREFKLKDILTYKKEGLVFVIWNDNKTVIEINVVPQKTSRVRSETNTIVPGVRVGDYKFGMSKDDVLKSLGKPKAIFHGGEKYTLNNLPKTYFMRFDDISFEIVDDSVRAIVVYSPLYKFTNGLGVGNSKQEFVEAFGLQFQFTEDQGKLYLTYEDKGLQFIIHKKNRTVMEFSVTKKISRLPKPIESVKPYDDVRWKDLSKLDFSARRGLIATLTFNQKTVWPEQAKMPPGSDPNKILTDALNPGLGVRELHQQGITGKGVNVAIIDQPVYLVHPEFAGKIVAYHDMGCAPHDDSSMHGPLVTSLLAGTHCGTAPGVRVYYVAAPSWKADAAYYAKGLDWIIAQNEKLPKGEKIRVVSVSASPNQSSWANRQMWDRACARAEADGIMVLDCTDSCRRGFIGKCWYDARYPENVTKCNPGVPPNRKFRVDPNQIDLLVPSSPRTAAEDGDVPGYQYAERGGLSRAIPYCAGVLAMGWQVRPDIGPEQMRELLFQSAYTNKNGAKIIYPRKFIGFVRKARPTRKAPRANQPNMVEENWTAEELLTLGRELHILEELGDAAAAWVSKGEQSSKVEVDRLIDLLLAQPNPSVEAYFASAKIANLCGLPDKAISILEDVVAKHGSEDGAGFAEPINLVAYHWIGSIARHSGNTARAIRAYGTILQNSKNLEGINQVGHEVPCKLYLAEIAVEKLKDKDLAMRTLDEVVRTIESIDKDKKTEEWDLLLDWAKYQRSIIKDGKIRARQQLAGGDSKKMEMAFMTAVTQLASTDVLAEGSSALYMGDNENAGEILSAASIRRVTENGRSRIDTSLARLAAGGAYEMEKSTEAEKHYSALFEEDSYFSPMGGIGLARCKKARGKADEANEVLEQVETRYPGYGPAVQKLKKSWK